MRTLRAFFWGSVIGAILGYLFAPRGSDIVRAEQTERETARQGRGDADAEALGNRPSGRLSNAS